MPHELQVLIANRTVKLFRVQSADVHTAHRQVDGAAVWLAYIATLHQEGNCRRDGNLDPVFNEGACQGEGIEILVPLRLDSWQPSGGRRRAVVLTCCHAKNTLICIRDVQTDGTVWPSHRQGQSRQFAVKTACAVVNILMWCGIEI